MRVEKHHWECLKQDAPDLEKKVCEFTGRRLELERECGG